MVIKMNDLEIVKWTPEQQGLIFQAFGIVIEDKVCHYCNEPLEKEKMCMFPDFTDKESYILTCNSPMCISEYITYNKECKAKTKGTER